MHEVRILDDLRQRGSDLRIKHLEIRQPTPSSWLWRHQIVHRVEHLHFFDAQNRVHTKACTGTDFCFEARLPTLECRQRREFIEMQLRDVILRLSDHVILWMSLFRERRIFQVGTFPANLGLGIKKRWVSFFVSLILAASLRVVESTGSSDVKVLSVHLVQMSPLKRFLAYCISSVCQAAGLNHGSRTACCLQIFKNLLNHWESSLHLVSWFTVNWLSRNSGLENSSVRNC